MIANCSLIHHLVDKGMISIDDCRDFLGNAASKARVYDNPVNQAAGDFIEYVFAPMVVQPDDGGAI